MCLIIDANLAPAVFGENSNSSDFRPVIDWLTFPKKNGKLVVGGKLKFELYKIENARRFIIRLIQAGRARDITENVDKETEKVRNMPELKSDDPHIIALAKVSGARILCSNDKDLREDFRNPKLIDPRGHIYQNAKQKHLLSKYGHTIACGQGKF
jgi:rRNA-processing protein FCF1